VDLHLHLHLHLDLDLDLDLDLAVDGLVTSLYLLPKNCAYEHVRTIYYSYSLSGFDSTKDNKYS